MIEFILIGAIIFLSAFVQGTAGLGFGMVAMGLIPLVLDVKFSIPFFAVYALIVCFMLMLQLRKYLDKKKNSTFINKCIAWNTYWCIIFEIS